MRSWGFPSSLQYSEVCFGANAESPLDKQHLKGLLQFYVFVVTRYHCKLWIQIITQLSPKGWRQLLRLLLEPKVIGGYWPGPCEAMGRWVGFGTTDELYIFLSDIPILVISCYWYRRCNCKTNVNKRVKMFLNNCIIYKEQKGFFNSLFYFFTCYNSTLHTIFSRSWNTMDLMISHCDAGQPDDKWAFPEGTKCAL